MVACGSRFFLIVHLIGLGCGILSISFESYALHGDMSWMNFIDSESGDIADKEGNSDLSNGDYKNILAMFRRINSLETFGTDGDSSLVLRRDSITEPLAIVFLIFCITTSGILLVIRLKGLRYSKIGVVYGILAITLYISSVMILFSKWLYDDTYYNVADHLTIQITESKITEGQRNDMSVKLQCLINCIYSDQAKESNINSYSERINFCQRSGFKYAAAVLGLCYSVSCATLFFYEIKSVCKINGVLPSDSDEVDGLAKSSEEFIGDEMDNSSENKANILMPTEEGMQTSTSELTKRGNKKHTAITALNIKTRPTAIPKTNRLLSAHSYDFVMLDRGYPFKQNNKAIKVSNSYQAKLYTSEGQQTSVAYLEKKVDTYSLEKDKTLGQSTKTKKKRKETATKSQQTEKTSRIFELETEDIQGQRNSSENSPFPPRQPFTSTSRKHYPDKGAVIIFAHPENYQSGSKET